MNCINGCLSIDHQILTENGWKDYKDINRKKISPDGKPIGINEKILVLDINNNNISTEEFIGELYYPKSNKVIYNIKNDYINTIMTEDHSIPYAFDLSSPIKIDKINIILYNMTKNNYSLVYFLVNSEKLSLLQIKKEEIIREIIEVEVFSFITSKKTFYVRKNGLEFWTSY